jgi:hypothetical protein
MTQSFCLFTSIYFIARTRSAAQFDSLLADLKQDLKVATSRWLLSQRGRHSTARIEESSSSLAGPRTRDEEPINHEACDNLLGPSLVFEQRLSLELSQNTVTTTTKSLSLFEPRRYSPPREKQPHSKRS